jgi:hypothetical protein
MNKEALKMFGESLKQVWNNVFRYGCWFLLFEIIALAAGFGVFMIAHGVWLLGSRLVLYWKPARVWLMNSLHIQDERYFQTPPFAWHRLLIQIVYFSLAGFMIFAGFKILIDDGFLHQNLIYLVLSQ